jgi:hypothetical protein
MSAGTAARPPRTTVLAFVAVLCVVGAAVGVPLLRAERAALVRETAAMRAAQATAKVTIDSLRATRERTVGVLALERARAAARSEPRLHLVVAVDSGTVALVRDGITLRTMPAVFHGAAPTRGTQTIASIAESVIGGVAPTVDSLGNSVAAVPETKVERVTLGDGTVLQGGDASAAILGGVKVAPGPRMIVVARRDFAAIRPNLVKGMKAVMF